MTSSSLEVRIHTNFSPLDRSLWKTKTNHISGGTAGNTVAGRLASNPDVKIAVIEAGTAHTREIEPIMTPARAFELRGSQYDWGFKATMVDRPDYTRVEKPVTRGKALGGSSIGNYYTWLRGSKGTYDDWEEFGGEGWNWEKCKEYFDKVSNC